MTEGKQQLIFKHWLQEHKALLFKVVRTYAFSETDRDDLFQEISIQVWRSIPNFREESAVTTWLYRVALNTAIRWNRKEQKHQDGRQAFDDTKHVLQKNNQPNEERLDWLYQEIAKLDEIDRSLCLLMLDGFSYRKMSDILGISESNIGVKIHRIKKHLINKSEQVKSHGI
ncbi:MAG TPA: RNA polymerase sigma factor [Balneolaceae bacterium]|nr:RNA polymerase sigma factor [Balneolaceae bacterium]